ncbi:MAG: class I SAM-dependent methyltransferase [Reyranellaceae bacterium]
MRTDAARALAKRKFRASPNFVLAFSLDGRAYVAKETEPYVQYWLTERDRLLLAMFSRRGGATVGEAIDAYLRLSGGPRAGGEVARLSKVIVEMHEAGVLAAAGDDVSRYSARIVEDYVRHRPFPQALVDLVVERAGIARASRVLDLAGGPGDLAIGLAHASDHVSLMELSRGFLTAASRRARQLGVTLNPLHESCNRLVFHDEAYDAVTVSQALHWLDDVLVCRGVCRVLRSGGSFFVIHSAISLADSHPLAPVLGNDSILGAKKRQPFVAEVAPLLKRLTLLFEALDSPDVQRMDVGRHGRASEGTADQRIVPAGVALFRQRRPFDMGYVRGFLTPQHVAATGQTLEAFLAGLQAGCAAATPAQMIGTHDWAVLHFRRGGPRAGARALKSAIPVEIGYRPGAVPGDPTIR